jgi:osmoprotectant transport system ATP-binding protein
MISLRKVSKRFPNSSDYAVQEFSLEVAAGETVVLVGPSGSGKTTVLRMINRLVEPTSGSILVDGLDVMAIDPVELRRGIGYVIQSIGLMPHRTVAQNIATVPRLLAWERGRIAARVEELAGMLELDRSLLARYPAELSGGQRQRVGVARALAVDPPVMLMDEPFGAVDPIVRARLQEQFLALQSRIRKTIVLVTHDMEEAIRMGDRIAIIDRGGHLEQYDTPEEILRSPANEFVANFVGSERALKRLGLRRVASICAEPGEVLTPDLSHQEAAGLIASGKAGRAAVVDALGAALGWVDAPALEGCRSVAQAHPHPFGATVSPHDTLREALDRLVAGRSHVAAVVSNGRCLGILTLEQISEAVRS